MSRVSLTFCGGCNPRIDRGQVADRLRLLLEQDGHETGYNLPDADAVIYISGCMASCAARNCNGLLPSVAVAAATVDAAAVEDGKLVDEVMAKVRRIFHDASRTGIQG